MAKTAAKLFGVLVGLLMIGGAKGCASSTGGGGGDYNSAKETAIGACENSVKKQLKSPSSASFSEEHADGGGDSYSVTGVVDADNSFGAKLRTTWSCDATRVDSSTWQGDATIDEAQP